MAGFLTLQQITELKDVFAAFDKDFDGSITMEDLGEAFAAVGQKVSREKLRLMMADADIDGNGVIDFPEFLTLVANKLKSPEEKELKLRSAFSIYDLGNTGYITATNLRFVMGRLGCNLTPEQAFEMINEADIDGDGRLSFEEFRRVMIDEQLWEI